MKKKKYSIWTNSEGFSIVDGLAMAFSSVYLFISILILFKNNSTGVNIELLEILTQPILVILGGYFASQGIQQFVTRNRNDTDKLNNSDHD